MADGVAVTVPIYDIQVGRFFVRGDRVCEVVKEARLRIIVRDYSLLTGESLRIRSAGMRRSSLAFWAERKATPEEIARMKRDVGEFLLEQEMELVLRERLAGIPNEMLIAEMRRRGLTLDDA